VRLCGLLHRPRGQAPGQARPGRRRRAPPQRQLPALPDRRNRRRPPCTRRPRRVLPRPVARRCAAHRRRAEGGVRELLQVPDQDRRRAVAHHALLLHGLLRGRPWPEAAEAQTKEPATGNSGETGQSLAGGGSSSSNVADHGAGETSGRFWNAAATSLTTVPPGAETAAALASGRRRGGA